MISFARGRVYASWTRTARENEKADDYQVLLAGRSTLVGRRTTEAQDNDHRIPTETPKIPPFAPDFVKGVCDVLAQTAFPGLSGSEIDSLLQMVRVEEREPGGNKRESLYITLYNVQVRQQAGNVVGGFIAKAMSPSRYAAQPG